MKIPAVSALFLVGSVCLVAAAPAHRETTERVSYTQSHQPDSHTNDGWIELASPTSASHGREFITVDAETSLTRLRIDAVAGRPRVHSVRVYYTDGTSMTVLVNKILDKKRQGSAVVDLQGARYIKQVVVNTARGSKGTYTVNGKLESHGVASR